MELFTGIESFINQFGKINVPDDRKKILKDLVSYLKEKQIQKEPIRLNFICTHNSRRSVLSQVWAQTLAYYFNIKEVTSYSGGSEVSSVYPTILDVFKEIGFEVNSLSTDDNAVQCIKYAANENPIICFSKQYNSAFNPKSKFAAILSCSHADKNCPLILGAEKRIAIPYEDPKEYDQTAEEFDQYKKRNAQIFSELHYVFSNINR